jgi:hypothetical protein
LENYGGNFKNLREIDCKDKRDRLKWHRIIYNSITLPFSLDFKLQSTSTVPNSIISNRNKLILLSV